jgi:K+-sensing histidine kinase KdpD
MGGQDSIEKERPLEDFRYAKGPKPWVKYTLAVAIVPVATLARLGLDRLMGEDLEPYSTFYLSVALIAWWAGRGPALVTLVLGLIAGLWAVVPPRNSLMVRGLPDVVEILIYLFVTITLVWLIHSLRQALRRTEEGRMELERLVDLRTAKLRQSIADLEHVSYSLVHDLRAPLRAMQMFSEMLVAKPSPVPEAK